MDPNIPLGGSAHERASAVMQQMRRALAEAGYEVWRDFSRPFGHSPGFMAIHRSPHGDGEYYDLTSAILIRMVALRRPGTHERPHLRIWRLEHAHADALRVIMRAVCDNLLIVRVMPHTLNRWRERRGWKPVKWHVPVQLTFEEIARLDDTASAYRGAG